MDSQQRIVEQLADRLGRDARNHDLAATAADVVEYFGADVDVAEINADSLREIAARHDLRVECMAEGCGLHYLPADSTAPARRRGDFCSAYCYRFAFGEA